MPTPLPILTFHSPLPLQQSTSNRLNNNISPGNTTHSLAININEKQSDYIQENGRSSSGNHSQNASKKTDKKTKLNNPTRKLSALSSESVKRQKTIKSAIETMKRKLFPEK